MSDLIVHQLPGGWGLPSVGPFSLKLETWLRMVGLPFRTVYDAVPFRGPKGKLPWIEHQGRRIGDSGFVIEYLEDRLGIDPDAGLGARERAAALALRRLLEENLYWVLVHDRWVIEENWVRTQAVVLGGIPGPLRALVGPIARQGVKRQLAGHGIGRHTREEIHGIGLRDLGAVADFLGDRPFLMGEAPTGIDAAAYGMLANLLRVPIESPVRDEGLRRPNLVEYLDRMQERCFG